MTNQGRPDLTHNVSDPDAPRPYAQDYFSTHDFVDTGAPRPYFQYDCTTQERPNLMYSMISRPKGAQTLHSVRFHDPRTPEPYAQHDLATQERSNLTSSLIWRPGGGWAGNWRKRNRRGNSRGVARGERIAAGVYRCWKRCLTKNLTGWASGRRDVSFGRILRTLPPDWGGSKYCVRASAELGDGPSSVPKSYAQYDLATQGCPNLTHITISRSKVAQTLRTL